MAAAEGLSTHVHNTHNFKHNSRWSTTVGDTLYQLFSLPWSLRRYFSQETWSILHILACSCVESVADDACTMAAREVLACTSSALALNYPILSQNRRDRPSYCHLIGHQSRGARHGELLALNINIFNKLSNLLFLSSKDQ